MISSEGVVEGVGEEVEVEVMAERIVGVELATVLLIIERGTAAEVTEGRREAMEELASKTMSGTGMVETAVGTAEVSVGNIPGGGSIITR